MTADVATVIRRVQKLRRLARSPNPHEAASAAAKAQALVERYQITPGMLAEDDDALLEVLRVRMEEAAAEYGPAERQEMWRMYAQVRAAIDEMARWRAEAVKAGWRHEARYGRRTKARKERGGVR